MYCARQLSARNASALGDGEKGPAGYVSTDKTLKGFQLSSRGRLDLALTTNTVNHIIAVSQKRSEKWKMLREFVGTKKAKHKHGIIFPTTQGSTFSSFEEAEKEVRGSHAH